MHYNDFDIQGEDELERYSARHPGRVSRLIDAMERFIEVGPEVASRLYPAALDEPEATICVYLVPPRAVLRGVPDMGGMMLADQSARILRLHVVFEEYGGDDDLQWSELTERAGRRAADQEKSHVRQGR